MSFELNDRVIIQTNTKEESKLPMFMHIIGKSGTITEIYRLPYQPETPRYEVTLDSPIHLENNEKIEVVPGLYEDNLMKELPEKKFQKTEGRALESFKVYESIIENSGKTKWYYGMADCHGLIAFKPEPGDSAEWDDIDMLFDLGMIPDRAADSVEKRSFNREVNMMLLTAKHNMQRYTLIYRAQISEKAAELIKRLMSKSLYEEALQLLKDSAEQIQVAKLGGVNTQKMWDKIPNPELDPMY